MKKYVKIGKKETARYLLDIAEMLIGVNCEDAEFLKRLEAQSILLLELAKRELKVGRYKWKQCVYTMNGVMFMKIKWYVWGVLNG